MKPLHRPSRLERWVQKKRNEYAQYDMERLTQVSLVCVIIVWGLFIEIFKPVMP